jgi:hypothetical protein
MSFNTQDIQYIPDQPAQIADRLSNLANIEVYPGVSAGHGVLMNESIKLMEAILAIASGTGAPASKFLLSPTVDYTIATDNKTVNLVTAQSANTLIFIYK